jgi:hypothetical protein
MGSKYNKHSNRSPFVLLSVLATLLWMSMMLTRTTEPGKRMSQRLHLNTAASTAEAAVGGWPLQHAPGRSPLSKDNHMVSESPLNHSLMLQVQRCSTSLDLVHHFKQHSTAACMSYCGPTKRGRIRHWQMQQQSTPKFCSSSSPGHLSFGWNCSIQLAWATGYPHWSQVRHHCPHVCW